MSDSRKNRPALPEHSSCSTASRKTSGAGNSHRSTDELLPCPFCGGEVAVYEFADMHGLAYDYEIGCEACEIEVMSTYGKRSRLLESWNTRAGQVADVQSDNANNRWWREMVSRFRIGKSW